MALGQQQWYEFKLRRSYAEHTKRSNWSGRMPRRRGKRERSRGSAFPSIRLSPFSFPESPARPGLHSFRGCTKLAPLRIECQTGRRRVHRVPQDSVHRPVWSFHQSENSVEYPGSPLHDSHGRRVGFDRPLEYARQTGDRQITRSVARIRRDLPDARIRSLENVAYHFMILDAPWTCHHGAPVTY